MERRQHESVRVSQQRVLEVAGLLGCQQQGAEGTTAPALPETKGPRVLVQRALPTEPSVRESVSPYLVEAERQGITPDRKMLYIGLEPASEHVAASLRVEQG